MEFNSINELIRKCHRNKRKYSNLVPTQSFLSELPLLEVQTSIVLGLLVLGSVLADNLLIKFFEISRSEILVYSFNKLDVSGTSLEIQIQKRKKKG